MSVMTPHRWVLLVCCLAVLASLWLKSGLYRSDVVKQSAPILYNHGSERENLIVYYHERRPYYITAREGVGGFVGKPVTDALVASGLAFQYQLTPAKRQLEFVKANESKCCALGWFKTAERLQYGRYSLPVYRDMPFVALAKKKNNSLGPFTTIDSVLSRDDLRLLVKAGYSYGAYIDQKLHQFSPNLVTTTGENQAMLEMILEDRADYCFLSEDEAFDLLLMSGIRRSDFRLIHFTDVPGGSYRYLLCSLNVSDEEMERLNGSLRQVIGLEDPL